MSYLGKLLHDFYYGNGADGNVIVSGVTSITLTGDMYYNYLNIGQSVIINTNAYKVFCFTHLVNNGTIKFDGNDAVKSVIGAAISSGTLAGSDPGLFTFSDPNVSPTLTNSIGGRGGGGGSRVTTAPTNAAGGPNPQRQYPYNLTVTEASYLKLTGGSGGDGGQNDGVGLGGSGGGGGGVLMLSARNISGSGTISVKGGNGGVAPDSDNSGGSGGGGGAIVITSENDPTATGLTFIYMGGTAGMGAGLGTNGSIGATGSITFIINGL